MYPTVSVSSEEVSSLSQSQNLSQSQSSSQSQSLSRSQSLSQSESFPQAQSNYDDSDFDPGTLTESESDSEWDIDDISNETYKTPQVWSCYN